MESDSSIYKFVSAKKSFNNINYNLETTFINIFTEKERCLFFIEEPDMFMHPSLQRAFLEVLSEYDQHQYFITSHSNHFLDLSPKN